MRYGSVCSGIEAATVAWHPLGWSPAWFSEIDAFPCALLAHHYPSVPNLGDMTAIRGRTDLGPIDLLVGGTPCQSFSVAGLRKGLDDPRGNLALVFLGIADAIRPRWVVWENVPGVLSSGGGRDFGAFLGGLAELGYGWAYRILDAQFVRVESHPRAVPQRRRRVFVVGHLGDWRRAAAVLLERESLCGHPPPSRGKGEGTAGVAIKGAAIGRQPHNGPQFGEVLTDGSCYTLNCTEQHAVSTTDVSLCLNAGGMGRIDAESETLVAHSLRAAGHDASEDGTGRGTPLVFDPLQVTSRLHRLNPETEVHPTCHGSPHAIAFQSNGNTDDMLAAGLEVSPTVRRGSATGGNPPAVAFAQNGHGEVYENDVANALSTDSQASGRGNAKARTDQGVRRLTPRECERLQGFPDGYTLIPHRGKPAADAPRYKALGNSMAVNCMSWLGQRIALAEAVPA